MTPADTILRNVRAKGHDVFVLPYRGDGLLGQSWSSNTGGTTGLHINVFGFDRTPEWARVLLHEAAHHDHGDTIGWSSAPAWSQEYAAERAAMQALAAHYDEATMFRLEQQAKDHIRPMMQGYIDAELWIHCDLDVALWAGCEIPDWLVRGDAA